jgi:two-component system sensor histidine kinase KdpD
MPRNHLKIYLGYAAGVGTTYQMLDEAQRLVRQGVDVVIGYFEPHSRADTTTKASGLEIMPRRIFEHGPTRFEEMDTDAILVRHPAVCLVDELAHTNVPGSEREKRWEDVHVLLDAGIEVLTTLNVQHLESLNDQVRQMSGLRVHETVPDWVLDEAQEVVLVDLSPRALRHRLERGVVYSPETYRGMEKLYTDANLNALREIALRYAAHEVEERLGQPSPRRERILICLTPSPSSAILLRRGKRVADYLGADCLAVHVIPRTGSEASLLKRHEEVEQHLGFARSLRVQTHVIESDNVPAAIADFARGQRVTQIFMGRPAPVPMWRRGKDTVQQVVQLAPDKQITIVAQR